MINTYELKVRLTFTEELLGSQSNNPKIHEEFIASKNPNAMARRSRVLYCSVKQRYSNVLSCRVV